MKDLKQKIGDQLRKIRIENNMSQEEFAYRISLHSNTYGKIERGERYITLERLIAISDIFHFSLEEFFSIVDPSTTGKSNPMIELHQLLAKKSKDEQKNLLKLVKDILEFADNQQKM